MWWDEVADELAREDARPTQISKLHHGHRFAPLAFARSLRNTRVVNVTQLTEQLIASYARSGGINHLDGKNLPSKSAIASITLDLLRLIFPGI